MAYDNWLTDIYTVYDGIFKHYEHEDETHWLRKIIQKNLGDEYLWDKDGKYLWEPKDEYEGYKRSGMTGYKDQEQLELPLEDK